MNVAIIREVYSTVAKKTQYEIITIFETADLADLSISLNRIKLDYPDDKVSIYTKLGD